MENIIIPFHEMEQVALLFFLSLNISLIPLFSFHFMEQKTASTFTSRAACMFYFALAAHHTRMTESMPHGHDFPLLFLFKTKKKLRTSGHQYFLCIYILAHIIHLCTHASY